MPKGFYNRDKERATTLKDFNGNKERYWLDTHGGRNKGDVKNDAKGKYVMMGDGYGNYEKVYLPLLHKEI